MRQQGITSDYMLSRKLISKDRKNRTSLVFPPAQSKGATAAPDATGTLCRDVPPAVEGEHY
jgi:hypothetical protein